MTTDPIIQISNSPIGDHDLLIQLADIAEPVLVKTIMNNRQKLGLANFPDPIVHICLLARETASFTHRLHHAPPDAAQLFDKLLAHFRAKFDAHLANEQTTEALAKAQLAVKKNKEP